MYYQASIFSSASCPTCFSFNYCKSSLQPNPSLICAKLTLLRTLLIQQISQRIRSQEKADKIRLFHWSFFFTQQQKRLNLPGAITSEWKKQVWGCHWVLLDLFQIPKISRPFCVTGGFSPSIKMTRSHVQTL